MAVFDYSDSAVPIRDDVATAHRTMWEHLASPGSWWSGAERVAIADEVRNAPGCSLCGERKQALSPYTVDGQHDHLGRLPEVAVEVVHRVVTDPGRLTRAWHDEMRKEGLGDAPYVELLGVLVAVVSIDSFHHALGLDLEPLPEPIAGEPSRYRPAQARDEGAYVPMIPIDGAKGAESDLWRAGAANIVRAMSLVPDAVRDFKILGAVHYLPLEQIAAPGANGGRAIDRSQMELIAGRVSSLNECFY
jgi:hypothetical protein